MDVLTYPFRGDGKWMLLTGGILSLVLHFASAVPLLGLVVSLFFFGYFTALFFDIVATTAVAEEDEAPDWPEITDAWSDIVGPIIYIVAAFVFSFLPLVVRLFVEINEWVTIGLVVLGLYHLPMAILAVALYRSGLAACPVYTVPAILRSFFSYTACVIILAAMLVAEHFIRSLCEAMPIAGFVVSFFVGIYFLMAYGRLLGLFYRRKPEIL